jgi:hypothetical protein
MILYLAGSDFISDELRFCYQQQRGCLACRGNPADPDHGRCGGAVSPAGGTVPVWAASFGYGRSMNDYDEGKRTNTQSKPGSVIRETVRGSCCEAALSYLEDCPSQEK